MLRQGLTGSCLTPALDDLKRQVGCDYEELTYTLVGRSVGVVVGAVGFGLINQRHQVRLTRQQSRVTVLVIFKNS